VYTARERIIVHAVLAPEVSAPVGSPTFYDLEANVDTDNGDEEGDADDPAVRPEDETDSESADTDEAAADDPEAPPQAGAAQDAFADGWFHDDGAWLHIALWGGALVLIAIAANRISRHFRRHSIGIACAAIPFVICLYFFYQNVNRLLPPGF
jgi:sortase A